MNISLPGSSRSIVGMLAAAALLFASPAAGQSSPAGSHNSGALTMRGGVDAPSMHFFRGIRQEREPKAIVQPFGELRIGLSADESGAQKLAVTLGIWDSLQTGSSGREGPSQGLHYQEDFYVGATLRIGGGLQASAAFAAATSPNSMFETRKEVRVGVSHASWLHPSALVALELNDAGQADRGSRKGTYLELGAQPRLSLMGERLAVEIPVKLGLSLKDYYEMRGGDRRFGFLDLGGLVTLPLHLPDRFGAWDVHGGASWLRLGDATKALNIDKDGNIADHEILWTFGVGVVY